MKKISLVIKNTLNKLKGTMQDAVTQLVRRIDGNYEKLAEIKTDMVECYQELDEILFVIEDFEDELCDIAEDCDCLREDLEETLSSPLSNEDEDLEKDYEDEDLENLEEEDEEDMSIVVEDEDGNEETVSLNS